MTMGKGGVGKTTIAAAVAVALAARGHQVQLTTTDPAAHLAGALGENTIGVQVSRIDPNPTLRARANEETRHLNEVTTGLARCTIVLPRTAKPPVGAHLLQELVDHQGVTATG